MSKKVPFVAAFVSTRDEINIQNSTMVGWFDAHPAVTVHTIHTETTVESREDEPLPTNWSGPYPGYIAGCAGQGPGSPPPPCLWNTTLAAAERACEAMPITQCAGITKGGTHFQLRQHGFNSVTGGGETSWARNCSIDPSSCPVKQGSIVDPVRATAFIQPGGRTLIALANFGVKNSTIKLELDWGQLGLDATTVKTFTAPELGGFYPHDVMGRNLSGTPALQETSVLAVGQEIVVLGAWGWLLLVEPTSSSERGLKTDDSTPVTTITVGPASLSKDVFEGVGGASGGGGGTRLLVDYPSQQRSDILDMLFKPLHGAALQHLKVEVGCDGDTTQGSEPTHARSATDVNFDRGYEVWFMEEAVRRRVDIALSGLE